MKISLTDSCYVVIHPVNPYKEVYVRENNTEFFAGFLYVFLFCFTIYIKFK